jgi:hypothetical protein
MDDRQDLNQEADELFEMFLDGLSILTPVSPDFDPRKRSLTQKAAFLGWVADMAYGRGAIGYEDYKRMLLCAARVCLADPDDYAFTRAGFVLHIRDQLGLYDEE